MPADENLTFENTAAEAAFNNTNDKASNFDIQNNDEAQNLKAKVEAVLFVTRAQ